MLVNFFKVNFNKIINIIKLPSDFNLAFILLCLSIQAIQCGVCPSPDKISPCTCLPSSISCIGNVTEINLVEVFEAISNNNSHGQQQFEFFELLDTSIELLPDDVFRSVTFKKIILANNPNLTCAHPNAFGGNANITTVFTSVNTSFASKLINLIL